MLEIVYLTLTVSGPIKTGDFVVVYAQFQDIQIPGMGTEAFFCGVKFPGALGTFIDADSALVATISGSQIDLASRNENPSFWAIDQRISPSLWLPDGHN